MIVINKNTEYNFTQREIKILKVCVAAITKIAQEDEVPVSYSDSIKVEDWFIKDKKQSNLILSPSSIRGIDSASNCFNAFFGENTNLDTITKENVLEFRNHLFSKVKSQVYWRTIKASLNRAVECGYLKINHFNTVKPPKRQEKKPTYLTREELNKILNCL